ncbi:MAG: uracil-DNA glycosylase [Clostridia bacterium]|nr:uracil-DNA glycosylase [Clostridia bacterium]
MYSSFQELKSACESCKKCELAETRTNIVFGAGDHNAEIMFVGEGPGEKEDLQGEPFVGRAGKLLDELLKSVDLSRDTNIYIANMVKCRTPKNRDPRPQEKEACIEWLSEQVRIISPKIIVCLGRVSAQRLISPDFKVTKQHGEFFEKDGMLIMGTFHPAALLRNPNQKPEALEDFVKLREKIKELSDK